MLKAGSLKTYLLATTLLSAGILYAGHVGANDLGAEPLKRYSLNIRAQNAVLSLQEIAKQTNSQIIFSPDQLKDVNTQPLQGHLSLDEALGQLLRGTRVSYNINGRGAVVVAPTPEQKLPPAESPPRLIRSTSQVDLPTPGLEEVIVTARRKEEKAQTVPLTLATFNQSNLENQQVRELKDLEASVPGMAFCCGRDVVSFLWIRGVAGAVVYFNDVPQINYIGGALFFDTGNVQVLKGPQGTLFGQSADGGAILYQSKPTVNDFEGSIEADVGDYGHREMQGLINIPVVDDKLIVRAGGLTNHTDGYVRDLTTGVETGSENFWIGRTTITLRPTDDIQNDFLFNYYYSDGVPLQSTSQYVNPNGLYALVYGRGILNYQAEQSKLGLYSFVGGTFRPGGEFASGDRYQLIDTARWDLNDNLTLKNILGYSQIDNGDSQTAAFGVSAAEYPLPALQQAQLLSHPLVAGPTQVLYTEELQAQGKAFDDKLSYTLGTFNAFAGTRQTSAPSYSAFFNSVTGSASWGDQRTNAVYGQGTYDLAVILEGLSFTGGYRYTWDKQYLTTWSYNAAGVLSANVSNLAHFHAPSYTLSLDYQLNPETLIYVTNAKGYSKGGFSGGNTAFIPELASFKPENLNNVEIGLKSDWQIFGIKTRTNVAAYYGFYGDVQAPTTALVPSPIPGAQPTAVTVTRNAATAHIEGFDADITIVPVDSVTLNGNVGYVHFKYDFWQAFDAGAGPDWSDAPQLYTPQLKYNINATYRLPILDWISGGENWGNAALSASYSWTMHTYGGLAYPNPLFNINPSFENLDLNLSWNNIMGRTGLDGRAYVTNALSNEHFAQQCSCYPTFNLGQSVAMAAVPRTWGVSVRYSFGPR